MVTALVTGASSGLGAEFARQLGRSGASVVLVARDAERLAAVAGEVRAAGGSGEVLVADLSRREDVSRVAARLDDGARPIDLLVNNAGYGVGRRFLDSPPEVADDALEVMVRAVMVLSRAAAAAMARRGAGRIVNVSSIAALLARGPYSAHKAWVETFTEALAVELHGTGVTATCVRPGLVRTEFQRRAGLDFGALPEAVWLDPAPVVRSALRASARGRVLVTPSIRYRLASAALRMAPSRWRRGASRSSVGR